MLQLSQQRCERLQILKASVVPPNQPDHLPKFSHAEMFIRFDDELIASFQRCSDWAHAATGKTCYWYACLSVIASLTIFLYLWGAGEASYRLAVEQVIIAAVFLYMLEERRAESADQSRHEASAASKLCRLIRGLFVMTAFCELLFSTLSGLLETLGHADVLRLFAAGFQLIVVYLMACQPRSGSPDILLRWAEIAAHALWGGRIRGA
jgi:hypothetical protein